MRSSTTRSRPGARLWVSGVESWRRLAARGLWVEGCGDNLGFDDVRTTLECPVLGLPPLRDWTALTYRWAVPGWRDSGVGNVIATYDILPPGTTRACCAACTSRRRRPPTSTGAAPSSSTHCATSLPAGAHHACGAGKTLRALRAAGADAQPFPNGREWQRWLH